MGGEGDAGNVKNTRRAKNRRLTSWKGPETILTGNDWEKGGGKELISTLIPMALPNTPSIVFRHVGTGRRVGKHHDLFRINRIFSIKLIYLIFSTFSTIIRNNM